MADPTAFPLAWPVGRPRTRATDRQAAKFGAVKTVRGAGGNYPARGQLSMAIAMDRLFRQVDLFGARYPLISSNVRIRQDGLPYSGERPPEDPGVAVYFQRDRRPYCLACDTFLRPEDNLAAVAAHIEATRAVLRYGVATAEETLRAFEALPSPEHERAWRDVLELRDRAAVTEADVQAAYRRLARERHPDHGGSDSMMADLNTARDRAMAEIRNQNEEGPAA